LIAVEHHALPPTVTKIDPGVTSKPLRAVASSGDGLARRGMPANGA